MPPPVVVHIPYFLLDTNASVHGLCDASAFFVVCGMYPFSLNFYFIFV